MTEEELRKLMALRKLNEEELSQLDSLKDSCRESATTPIKVTQKTTAGYALDFTKYLASGYVDKAFEFGWDKTVATNQETKTTTEDPTNKVYRNSILVGAASWFAIPAVIATIATIVAPPVGLIAWGVAAAFGVVGAIAGAIDGYSETRTIKRAIELGEVNAKKEITGIVNRGQERAKLKEEIKNEFAQEKAQNTAVSSAIASPLQPENQKTQTSTAAA